LGFIDYNSIIFIAEKKMDYSKHIVAVGSLITNKIASKNLDSTP